MACYRNVYGSSALAKFSQRFLDNIEHIFGFKVDECGRRRTIDRYDGIHHPHGWFLNCSGQPKISIFRRPLWQINPIIFFNVQTAEIRIVSHNKKQQSLATFWLLQFFFSSLATLCPRAKIKLFFRFLLFKMTVVRFYLKHYRLIR